MKVNQLTNEVAAVAIEVHRALGPGLLESTYEEYLCRELDCGYRLDLLTAEMAVVGIKTVESLLSIHGA